MYIPSKKRKRKQSSYSMEHKINKMMKDFLRIRQLEFIIELHFSHKLSYKLQMCVCVCLLNAFNVLILGNQKCFCSEKMTKSCQGSFLFKIIIHHQPSTLSPSN